MVQALDDYDVIQDLPQAFKLLDEMNNNVKQVSDLVESMLQRVKTGEISTEYGLNFLEIKYHMLLNYLINLTYVVLRKCSGQTVQKDPSIDRLIEIRTILEKIRPIDYKLRYQIDKLVKTAVIGATSSADPISFKANPDNLISQLPGDQSDSTDQSDSEAANKKAVLNKLSSSKVGVYVPPKITAVHYEGEESKIEKDRKLLERARKRALTSSILQDLKEEYLETPVEVSSGSRAQQIISKAQREKEEYEEAYLTRLPVTKAEKHKQRKLTTLGTLGDELTSFADISVLQGELDKSSVISNKRKKTSSGKKRAGKKRRRY